MKLKLPENMKDVNSMAGQFLLILFATTLSIVLTFGAAAIIDNKKKEGEKRKIVLMLMYDMQNTLSMMEQCDTCLNRFFDTQVKILANPESFDSEYSNLMLYVPIMDYSLTTENIFRSSIETINTIGNIIFVEKVSAFYDKRADYKALVLDEFSNIVQNTLDSYEGLAAFKQTAQYPLTSTSYLLGMKDLFEECKVLMNVSDNELQAFADEKYRLEETMQDTLRRDQILKEAAKTAERKMLLKEASEKGKSTQN